MIRQALQIIKNNLGTGCAPVELIAFVTNRCNLSCGHCFVDRQQEAGGELTLDEFEKISRSLPALLSLMLTGGEPFLRRDIAEIVSIFDRNSRPRVIAISSNGSLTDSIVSQLDSIAGKKIKSRLVLTFSLDGNAETHNRIRGNGAYEALMATLSAVSSSRAREGIVLGMNITFSGENEHLPFSVYEEVFKKYRMDFMSCNLARGKSREGYRQLDINKYAQLCAAINRSHKINFKHIPAALCYLHGLKEEYQAGLISKVYGERRYQGVVCEAGRNIAVVGHQGGVYPCELLQENFGNIRMADPKKIWNSAKNRAFAAQAIRRGKCFCHHECFISASVNTNLRNLLKMFFWKLRRG